MVATRPTVPSAVSDRKRLANQLNSQRSTGPKTPDGKERSSKNSTTHGFFAKDIMVLGEDPVEYKAYRIAMLRRLDPRDEFEMEYAEQFISAGWKLKRLRAAECETYNGRISSALEGVKAIRKSYGMDEIALARPDHAPKLLASDLKQPRSDFARYQTYELRLQNMMNKAHKQLRMLQDETRPGLLSEYAGKLVDKEDGRIVDGGNEATEVVSEEQAESSATDRAQMHTDKERPLSSQDLIDCPKDAPSGGSSS